MTAGSLLAGAVVLVALLLHVQGDFFTSVRSLEGLLQTEAGVVEFLKEYIQMEEDRIKKLRLYHEKYEKQLQEASPDVKKYVQNPTNSFLMVKHLSKDWGNVKKLLYGNHAHVRNFLSNTTSLSFPTEDDLMGAAIGLLRIQDVYNLEVSAVARGEIPGSVFTSNMTASDCYELGINAIRKNTSLAILWLEEALERIAKENTLLMSKEKILQELNALYFEKTPEDLDAKNVKDSGTLQEKESKEAKNVSAGSVLDLSWDIVMDNYKKLCRGETISGIQKTEDLTCRYTSRNHPFYLFQPFKEETILTYPKIIVYHDLMNDGEIKSITELASTRLTRATTVTLTATTYPDYRISKRAFLPSKDLPALVKIDQRMDAVTGLNWRSSEDLQVANYGIGGQYEPHYDYIGAEFLSTGIWKILGNRIATLMFYMSDVESGGATVFPYLGVTVWPKKGSALFWYNLFLNGSVNRLTRHAACPVLVGSKWVGNKWIHERGQEFRSPCSLRSTE